PVGPLTVPATIALTLADQPVDDARDVDPEIGPVGNSPAVDALLDLALPVRLAGVIPARIGADQFDGTPGSVRRRIETELPEWLQRKARGRPRLPAFFPLALLETGRDKGAARPLPVIVLMGKEPGSPALGLDLGPLRRPLRFRNVEQVAHHLPPDRWVGVKQP